MEKKEKIILLCIVLLVVVICVVAVLYSTGVIGPVAAQVPLEPPADSNKHPANVNPADPNVPADPNAPNAPNVPNTSGGLGDPLLMSDKDFDFKKLNLSSGFDGTKDFYYCKGEFLETALQQANDTSWKVVCAVYNPGIVIYSELTGCQQNINCNAVGNNVSILCEQKGNPLLAPYFCGYRTLSDCKKLKKCDEYLQMIAHAEYTKRYEQKRKDYEKNGKYYEENDSNPTDITLRLSEDGSKKLDVLLRHNGKTHTGSIEWQSTIIIKKNIKTVNSGNKLNDKTAIEELKKKLTPGGLRLDLTKTMYYRDEVNLAKFQIAGSKWIAEVAFQQTEEYLWDVLFVVRQYQNDQVVGVNYFEMVQQTNNVNCMYQDDFTGTQFQNCGKTGPEKCSTDNKLSGTGCPGEFYLNDLQYKRIYSEGVPIQTNAFNQLPAEIELIVETTPIKKYSFVLDPLDPLASAKMTLIKIN